MKPHVGSKFFKYNNDVPEMFRLLRIKNQDTFVLKDENGTRIKVSAKELQSDYIKLIADGIITLSIVTLQNHTQDVVLTLHRMKDIDQRDDTPWVICRQSIFDIFTNLVNHEEDVQYAGLSISRESCPPDIEFKECSACESVIKCTLTDVYMDDTFEDIMSLLDVSKANDVLRDLAKHNEGSIRGWSANVRELLLSTRFMYDFLRAFDIYPLNFTITVNEEDHTIPVEQVEQIEDIIKSKINAIMVVPYSKEIDLKEINQKYILVSDAAEKIYVVAFQKGEYINRPYEQLEDHRDRDAMINIIKNRHG